MKELSEQKKAEIRLIADPTFEATVAVDARISKLAERRVDEAQTTR